MKKHISFLILLFGFIHCFAQNVGINNDGSTADVSAMLDVKSTTKGMLMPRMTQAQRLALVTPSNGLMVFQTDGQSGIYYNAGTPFSTNWQGLVGGANWLVGGNSLVATGNLGTTSNNHVDLITNNIVRGRLSNLGEFLIGTTNTTVSGDLMGVVSNATFPFAVNGFSSFNGSGVYGAVQGSNTQFAGVQGEYQGTIAGSFNTAGVRGSNQSGVAGTGFRTQSTTGPRVGVIGNTTITNGQFTFGVHGSMGSTDIRSAGVFGDDFGIALGAIGYYAANLVDYSVYGFGIAFQTGVAGGRVTNLPTTPNTHIGLGIYGGVMGGWMRGLVYGTHLKGERYSLYVDGKTYTNEPIAELVAKADGSRLPAYGVVTEQPEVYAKGKAALENGSKYILFSEVFQNLANAEDIIVTVSPLANSKGLYIAEQDAKGFLVKENANGNGFLQFAWMAIAGRKDIANLNPAPELLQKDFDQKMNNVMFNDNNMQDKPQYLWWDGKNIRYDKPPAKQVDKNYNPVGRSL